jgi:hypothetical protein
MFLGVFLGRGPVQHCATATWSFLGLRSVFGGVGRVPIFKLRSETVGGGSLVYGCSMKLDDTISILE